MWCGHGEVCFTREFTNHHGVQSFSMGCESKARCNLFTNAGSLFGKRQVDDQPFCFACCETTECNSGLCRNAITGSGNTPNKTGCPHLFVHGPAACYFVANWTENWRQARRICRNMGGDLVSIDDQTEQDYLVHELRPYEAMHTPNGMWTGGYYVPATQHWTWMDLSAATYSHWGPSQPRYQSTSYYIALANPGYSSYTSFKNWAWLTQSESSGMGFICESPFV
ncbi:perlucin-like protein [Gigantopelta aegis]|uniref:perlucin-like protein n=1 Tax=Gigantopelta aegis TaxID=1735272 RepID=UPI001B88D2C0|nr:perlucin-like protein [Gigantopelta aegis]